MIEIFENVREEVKEVAETAWNLAIAQSNPIEAVDLLTNIVSYYKNLFTEQEIEFLQFYFNMKMEMIKE